MSLFCVVAFTFARNDPAIWKLTDQTRCRLTIVNPKSHLARFPDGNPTEAKSIFDAFLQKRLGLSDVLAHMDQSLLVVQGSSTHRGIALPNLRFQYDKRIPQDFPLIALGQIDSNWIAAYPLNSLSGIHPISIGVANGPWKLTGKKLYRSVSNKPIPR